jgi:hypothetical protein
MIEYILIALMIGCAIIFIIAAIMGASEWFQHQSISTLTLSQLPVSKKHFCELVMEWCEINLQQPKSTKPSLTINYYSNKSRSGVYYSSTHDCVIYVNSHHNIQQVVNTVIHEYVHALQRSKNFDKLYNKYQKEVGYDQNPFEIEAREISKKCEKDCLLWVYNRIHSK